MNIGGTELLTDLASGGGVTDHTKLTNIGTNTHASIDSFIASKGANNGICDLTAQGKVPTSRLPVSSQSFLGLWNATTNTPTIVSGTGNLGDYYVVNVAGTTNIDGVSTWQIDDKIIYTGSKWERIDEPDPVIYEEVLNTNYKTNKNIPIKNIITTAQLTDSKHLITKEYHDTLATIQDNKIITLETQCQNIDPNQTNASRTYFNGNIETTGNINVGGGFMNNGSCPGSFSVGFLAPSPLTNVADIGTSALRFRDIFIGSNIDHPIFKVNTLGNVTMNDVTSSNTINGNFIILNNQAQSNKYYNKNGTAGLDIGNTSTGAINLTGSKYQNNNNAIVTLNASGQIQQPSNNARVDGNGNIDCKNATLTHDLEVGTTNGFIKASKLQSRLNTDTLILNNLAPNTGGNGRGITIDATVNGNVQLTGDSYIGTANAMMRLNTNGTIEKTPCTIDGASNNNISNVNNLTCTAVISSNILNSNQILSPNFTLGTFGGGTSSAGVMDLNSGRINNILRLEWYTSNISVGNSAIYNIGNNNICIGEGAGSGLTSGDNCIFIGGTQTVSTTSNNQIVIGNGISRRANEFICGSSATSIVRPDADNVTDLGVRDGTGNHQWKDIYFTGNLYKNGALFTGGGGVTGISSALGGGGANDHEISFTGDDYLVAGTLKITSTGKIYVVPDVQETFSSIAQLFQTEYKTTHTLDGNTVASNNDITTVHRVYVPNANSGSWTQANGVFIIWQLNATGTYFKEYVEFSTHPNNSATSQMARYTRNDATVANAVILHSSTPWTNIYGHISNHFINDFFIYTAGTVGISQIYQIWLLNGASTWNDQQDFYVDYQQSNGSQFKAVWSLWGSPNGMAVGNPLGGPPGGAVQIFP